MNIANLKIGKRLALAFGLVCVALVVMVGQATLMLGRVNEGTKTLATKRIPRIQMSNQLQSEVNDVAIALRNMILFADTADRAKQVEEVVSSRKAMQDILARLDKELTKPKSREVLRRQVEMNDKYTKGQDELMAMIQRGDDAGAREYLAKQLRPVLAAYKEAIAQQITQQTALAEEEAVNAQQTFEETRLLQVGLGVLTLGAACWLALWITRSITRPLARAVQAANAVADGDLTSRIEVAGKCEVSDLLRALKSMNEHLADTVGTVRAGTDAIALASGEVASGNQDLSARTEQQASSLEETASSMEELTSTVKQNADNARQANVLAATASNVAARGGEVVRQVVSTMDGIHAASSRITDIIGVIDGIAFQTNILALNAAVEAARAGEQGRGFAVVAGEVRSLAQRSAAAAKEIKSLIDDSGKQVATGSRLVQEAGGTMGEIVESVRRVTDILNEITSASVEQSAGIEQINEAVTQMDTVTQQNAALVEEAAAAAQSLQDEAARLAEAVSVFRIEGSTPAAAPRAVAKPAAKLAVKPAAKPVLLRPALTRSAAVRTDGAKPVAAGAASEGDWEEF